MTTRRRWTAEAIKLELRALIDAQGRWPTQRELEARGLGAMVRAMRRFGDRAYWQAALADERADDLAPTPQVRPRHPRHRIAVPPAISPPAEHIAVAAYFLYRNGHPGDHLAHWVTAENQLRATG